MKYVRYKTEYYTKYV